MSALALDGVSKTFATARGARVRALEPTVLRVHDGELVALLGASGCGKSTLLRLIAGFETPDTGTIRLGERLVSGEGTLVPPEERRVGIVFQSYALWPHMSVGRNVGYALEVAHVSAEIRRARVAAALESVDLAGYEDRNPAELSGGQRQRVALARCLAMDPAVVLLDEPLANLDVHLRASMLEAFAAFHVKTKATMLYVTHDQAEAMALADRIAVMDAGCVVQFSDPRTLYREPATAAIGAFVGRGTVVDVRVLAAQAGQAGIELHGRRYRVRCADARAPGAAKLVLRPEDLALSEDGFPARIGRVAYVGGSWDVDAFAEADPATVLRLSLPDAHRPAPGAAVNLALIDGWVPAA
ncbi:MAG: ABC transporter ATP-binding protein [Azospirillum sp.]|nr:ABC transporter ATP-binding protein [Azospirillum sp.]MCZ8122169.1 ABC transporter ATP-binding protein [Magnetospirillum sp.]